MKTCEEIFIKNNFLKVSLDEARKYLKSILFILILKVGKIFINTSAQKSWQKFFDVIKKIFT